MTTKEKLKYFSNHGMSITYIAKLIEVNPSTLTKWLNDQKGITHKNEDKIENILKKIIGDLSSVFEE